MKLFIVLVCFAALFVQNSIQQNRNQYISTIRSALASYPSLLQKLEDTLRTVALNNDDAAFNKAANAQFEISMKRLDDNARFYGSIPSYAVVAPPLRTFISQLRQYCDLMEKFGISKAYFLQYYQYVTYWKTIIAYSEEFVKYRVGHVAYKKDKIGPNNEFTIKMPEPRTNAEGLINMISVLTAQCDRTFQDFSNIIDSNDIASPNVLYLSSFTFQLGESIRDIVAAGMATIGSSIKDIYVNRADSVQYQLTDLSPAFRQSADNPKALFKKIISYYHPGVVSTHLALAAAYSK